MHTFWALLTRLSQARLCRNYQKEWSDLTDRNMHRENITIRQILSHTTNPL